MANSHFTRLTWTFFSSCPSHHIIIHYNMNTACQNSVQFLITGQILLYTSVLCVCVCFCERNIHIFGLQNIILTLCLDQHEERKCRDHLKKKRKVESHPFGTSECERCLDVYFNRNHMCYCTALELLMHHHTRCIHVQQLVSWGVSCLPI